MKGDCANQPFNPAFLVRVIHAPLMAPAIRKMARKKTRVATVNRANPSLVANHCYLAALRIRSMGGKFMKFVEHFGPVQRESSEKKDQEADKAEQAHKYTDGSTSSGRQCSGMQWPVASDDPFQAERKYQQKTDRESQKTYHSCNHGQRRSQPEEQVPLNRPRRANRGRWRSSVRRRNLFFRGFLFAGVHYAVGSIGKQSWSRTARGLNKKLDLQASICAAGQISKL